MTEKRILFSRIISWAPLQATKKKQKPVIQPNPLIKGINKVKQKPDSSASVSFEAGLSNSDLWEFDANSQHLFIVQHYLKQWGRGGAAEGALLQPCPQTMQCSFTSPEHPSPDTGKQTCWTWCGNGEYWCVVTVTLLLALAEAHKAHWVDQYGLSTLELYSSPTAPLWSINLFLF